MITATQMIRLRGIAALCGCLLYPMMLFAQTQTRTIEFRVFGLPANTDPKMYTMGPSGKLQAIQFKARVRSDSYQAQINIENPQLHFYGASDTAGQPHILSSAQIDPDWQTVLCVFSKSTDAGVSLITIPDDTDSLSPGTLRVLNLSGIKVLGRINGQNMQLPTRQLSSPVPLETSQLNDIRIAAEGPSQHHLVYQNQLRIQSSSRALLILRPPRRPGSIHIATQLLTDTPQTEPANGDRD